MKELRYFEIKKILQSNKYVLVVSKYGEVFTYNCGLLKCKYVIESMRQKHHLKKSLYVSIRPCSFSEYIRLKTPFLTYA